MAARITKEEALSFLLTHLVIEKNQPIALDQMSLFELMNLAAQGADTINNEEEAIPHEILQELAQNFGAD
ncbi:MAG: hypothetical protein QGI68_06245 [Pseudomonadales bacterium]|jgi:hypothetical protein|nr:hypothetical protein [Pseudomonadales bacterium]MDP7146254.1 hypothetical protein [Pseudomonadales bacterium]MDP7359684.1 hypothetical protein [Pseudomonadales bacterium]MDP7595153.1 hypothetical protein [Pseudomonadales bacterium]HJN50315.1 hypothetical protein [Pseudomonadales bacterium]|tara:strand:- start:219 stop:428 length:210 start_codon:yes stop_codon:yes gene_type:complete